MKIATWFTVPINLSFRQWFELIAIINLILYEINKKEKSDSKSPFVEMIVNLLTEACLITMVLGAYYIIKFFI